MTKKKLTIQNIDLLMEIKSKDERINQLNEWNVSLQEINIGAETLDKGVNSKYKFTVEQEDAYIKMSGFLYTTAAGMACKLKFPTIFNSCQDQGQINNQTNDTN